jgi:hypothetical protein
MTDDRERFSQHREKMFLPFGRVEKTGGQRTRHRPVFDAVDLNAPIPPQPRGWLTGNTKKD